MKIISRLDWGAFNATKPGGSTAGLGSRDAFMGHYSTGEELGRKDTAAWVREIQKFHMGPQRGWADIGYNFLIDVYGNVFEGRGWNYVGAHCPNWNTRAFGVCFLGDDDPGVTDVSEAAKVAFRQLYQEAEDRTPLRLRVMGHRDGKATACPGDELHHWLRSGMPVNVPTPPPAPKPTPTPTKPSPGRAPAFPLPRGDYFGPNDDGPRGSCTGRYHHRGDLLKWQAQMKRRGWRLVADGLYGPQTRTIAGKFQAQKRLPVDGLIGPKTWAAAWESPIT